MNPYIRKLVSEHEHGLVQLGFLDDATRRLVEKGFNEEDFKMIKKSVDFISKEIRSHNESEERNLFPLLEKHLQQNSPTQMMRTEHRMLWEKMDRLIEKVEMIQLDNTNTNNYIALRWSASEIVNLLSGHINKENIILFHLVERTLTEPELKTLTDLV